VPKEIYSNGILAIAVSGTTITNLINVPEAFADPELSNENGIKAEFTSFRAGGSNFGEKVAVSAPGYLVVSRNKQGTIYFDSGTSFSAPMVSGLAAEMIYFDRNLGRRKEKRELAGYILKLLQSTADNLHPNTEEILKDPFKKIDAVNDKIDEDSSIVDRDKFFGYGRINAWKAMLAVANNGIATKKYSNGIEVFKDVPKISHKDTRWYGFIIRVMNENYKNAIVYLDDKPLEDDTNLPEREGIENNKLITAYLAYPKEVIYKRGDVEVKQKGVIPVIPSEEMPSVFYQAVFSISREELAKATELRLKKPGAEGFFYRLPLDRILNEERKLTLKPGEDPTKFGKVSFDDFVFTVEASEK
jgi:hypothetical protein